MANAAAKDANKSVIDADTKIFQIKKASLNAAKIARKLNDKSVPMMFANAATRGAKKIAKPIVFPAWGPNKACNT